MRITEKQIKLITQIDKKINFLFECGANKNFVINALNDFKPTIYSILQSIEPKQIELYLAANKGFQRYLMLCGW